MDETTTTPTPSPLLGAGWSDPLEDEVRGRVRAFIEEILEEELSAALGRGRYERAEEALLGWRNGHRDRQVIGTFGAETVRVPRARLVRENGGTAEWRSKALRRYQRLTKRAEALIAGAYLAGTNTRRVRRALAALFDGAVGKDVVSRTWRKVRTDWEAWNGRDLGDEDIVRLILDGTVVRAKIDRKATAISLLVAIGVRRDGETGAAGAQEHGRREHRCLDRLSRGHDPARPERTRVRHRRRCPRPRGMRRVRKQSGDCFPDDWLAALWPDVPVQRCTVHKHRNLLAHAPKRLHDELTNDYRDMIYADTAVDVEARRKAFLRKWRLKCRAVADSLEEAGDRLFTFTRLPPGQWKSVRTTNAIERLHEEFRRRIKTQTVLPEAETAPMLFWALLASGQIVMRKVDGWETLAEPLAASSIDLAA